MITSTQQRNKVAKQIETFRARLDTPPKAGVPAQIAKMGKAQLVDSIRSLESEIEEYDLACSTPIESIAIGKLTDLTKLPILIRLSQRMAIGVFASYVGISESQIKRYEAQEYANAPTGVVFAILEKFQVDITGTAHIS